MVIHSSGEETSLSLEIVGFEGSDAVRSSIEAAALAALKSAVDITLIDCPDFVPSGEGAFMSRRACCAPSRRALAYVSLYDASGGAAIATPVSHSFLGGR